MEEEKVNEVNERDFSHLIFQQRKFISIHSQAARNKKIT
tara:strand:+ start:131 stop:247 length:117 start_codon:yes stop_codon:yes gene_type:complete